MIDNIEHSVSKATDYVNDAVEQVYIAQEAHKSVMKVGGNEYQQESLVFYLEKNRRMSYFN